MHLYLWTRSALRWSGNGAVVSTIFTKYKNSCTNHSHWREQDEYVTVNNSLIWVAQLEWLVFLVRFRSIAIGVFQLGWSHKNRLVIFISNKAEKERQSDHTINACCDNLFNLSDDIRSKYNLRRSGRTCCLSMFSATPIKIKLKLCLYSDNYHGHENIVELLKYSFPSPFRFSFIKTIMGGSCNYIKYEKKWNNGVRWWLLVLTVIAHRNPTCKKSSDTYHWFLSLRNWVWDLHAWIHHSQLGSFTVRPHINANDPFSYYQSLCKSLGYYHPWQFAGSKQQRWDGDFLKQPFMLSQASVI